MTKQELLNEMQRMGACLPAQDYVRNHASNDAQEIWSSCDNLSWLFWYAFRKSRRFMEKFAFCSANRAKKFAIIALRNGGHNDAADRLQSTPVIVDRGTALQVERAAAHYAAAAAASYAAHCAAAAAHPYAASSYAAHCAAAAADANAASYAANCASYAAHCADAERKLQLKRMQRWQVR